MPTAIKKTFAYGAHTVTLETGEVARQAGGAVIVNMDETVVLATVVGAKEARPGQDFFPLTVDYVEKFYAAGRIPGGFFKREGRPSEKEILTSRLIDRPIRPLFPDGFMNEVQVIITVLSLNPEIDSDIPAMIGASAALAISGLPFNGPVGAARVGYLDGQYILNPTATELQSSQMNLVVAGTQTAVLMVESEAQELPEDVMLGAVMFGHEQMQTAIKAINELVEVAGKPEWDWQAAPANEPLIAKVNELAKAEMEEAFRITSKQERSARLSEIRKRVIGQLTEGVENAPSVNELKDLFFNLESGIVRSRILNGEPRIDGRDTRTVRPITIRTFDLGNDKNVPYETIDDRKRDNPALGLRSIRLSLAEPRTFQAQLRAILRVSKFGKVKILIPMLSHAHQIDQTLAALEQAKSSLRGEKIAFDENIEIGGMVEVPAAALAVGLFLRRLDFISIGTNDLIQYTLAIDRADEHVANLYDPLHPAVLMLLAHIISSADKASVPVSMCGEMAGDPTLTRLLLGMGLRQFSMHPAQIPAVKQRIKQSDISELVPIVRRILRLEESSKIQEQIERLNLMQV